MSNLIKRTSCVIDDLIVENLAMTDAFWIVFIALFFVFGLPIIFIIFYFERIHKPLEKAKIEGPREVIVKEVVMVPCRYCEGLIPNTATFCPNCGAPKKN